MAGLRRTADCRPGHLRAQRIPRSEVVYAQPRDTCAIMIRTLLRQMLGTSEEAVDRTEPATDDMRRRFADLVSRRAFASSTVSYTHLTLPTTPYV